MIFTLLNPWLYACCIHRCSRRRSPSITETSGLCICWGTWTSQFKMPAACHLEGAQSSGSIIHIHLCLKAAQTRLKKCHESFTNARNSTGFITVVSAHDGH